MVGSGHRPNAVRKRQRDPAAPRLWAATRLRRVRRRQTPAGVLVVGAGLPQTGRGVRRRRPPARSRRRPRSRLLDGRPRRSPTRTARQRGTPTGTSTLAHVRRLRAVLRGYGEVLTRPGALARGSHRPRVVARAASTPRRAARPEAPRSRRPVTPTMASRHRAFPSANEVRLSIIACLSQVSGTVAACRL